MMLLPRRATPLVIVIAGLLLARCAATAQSEAGGATGPQTWSELEVERALRIALARDDRTEAARLLLLLPMPSPAKPDFRRAAARRDLYAAGTAEDDARFDRYLAVARSYNDREEGLVALVSAIEGWTSSRFAAKSDDGVSALALDRRHFEELRSLLAAQKERAPDDPRVALAHERLATAVSGGRSEHASMIRISGRPAIPLPHPLVEDVDLSIHRLADFEALTEADVGAMLPPAFVSSRFVRPALGAAIDLPGPGLYAVALRPSDGTCQIVRRVLESDLDLAVHASQDGGVVQATIEGKPKSGVTIVAKVVDTEIANGETDDHGVFAFAIPPSHAGKVIAVFGEIAAPDGGRHLATVSMTPARRRDDVIGTTMHLLVDRPLYRSGETVRGRIVCRESTATDVDGRFGTTRDGSTTRPLVSRAVDVRLRGPGGVEMTSRRTTDDLGAADFEFALPRSIGPGGLYLSAELPLEDGERLLDPAGMIESRLHDSCLAEVADFVRPPLLFEVSPIGAADTLLVSATLPSGIPAVGISGRIVVTAGSFTEQHAFATDASGLARLSFQRDHLLSVDIRWKVSVAAPDGQLFEDSGIIRHVARATDAGEDAPDRAERARPRSEDSPLRLVADAEEYVVGQALSIAVSGPPQSCVLLTVARGVIFDAATIVLDTDGAGIYRLPLVDEHAPRISIQADVVGLRGQGPWMSGAVIEMNVLRVADRLGIVIDPGSIPIEPGALVEWHLDVKDGDGNGVPATVAMSVVDESLYLLAEDRTADVARALRPPRRDAWLTRVRSLSPSSEWQVLGELFVDGRIDRLLLKQRWSGGGATGGGASPGGGGARVRSEFRATAFFDGNIRTDGEGHAVVKFRFPDDIATWRVTIHAVGTGAGATTHVERVRTSRSPAVDVRLPRILRAGDEIDVPLLVTQDVGKARELVLESGVSGSLGASTTLGGTLATLPGRAVKSEARVVAQEIGEGRISASIAEGGERLDAIERSIEVGDAKCRRSTFATAILDGTTKLEPEWLEGTVRESLSLTFLGSIDQQLVAAAAELNSYPHGCAEQTCSRLMPIVAAAHATWSLGGTLAKDAIPPAGQLFTLERAQRLETGLERLRRLQTTDGGFGWWPGDVHSDAKVSAGVLRFLALLAEIGVDPRHYGIRVGKDTSFASAAISWPERFAALPERATFRLRELDPLVDVTASLLLLHPNDSDLADLAARALDESEFWGVGTIARLGLALRASGRPEDAGRALDLALARVFDAASRSDARSIYEAPLVRLATTLELCVLVRPEAPEHSRLLATLLHARASGSANTAANAAVIVALARERRRSGADSGPRRIGVKVACEGFAEERVIDTSSAEPLVVDLPRNARRIEITMSAKTTILAIARAVHSENAASARPIGSSAKMTQSLLRVAYGPDGDKTLTPLGDHVVRAGDVICRRLHATLPPDATYLLLVAPMPAGFEAVRGGVGQVLTDADVSIGIASVPRNGIVERDVLLVASNTGTVMLPPAEVFAMYDPELFARTEGCRLVVAPRDEAGVTASVRLFDAGYMSAALKSLCDEVERTPSIERKRELLDRIVRWPATGARHWFESRAIAALGRSLGDEDIFDDLVSGLEDGFADWLERDGHLEKLLHLVEKDGDDGVCTLARLVLSETSALSGFRDRHRDRGAPEPDVAERLSGLLDLFDPPDHPDAESGSEFLEFSRLFEGERVTAYPRLRAERVRFLLESGKADDALDRLFGAPFSMVVAPRRQIDRVGIGAVPDEKSLSAARSAMRTATRLFEEGPVRLRIAMAARFLEIMDRIDDADVGSTGVAVTSAFEESTTPLRREIERLSGLVRAELLAGLAVADFDEAETWIRFASLGRDGVRPSVCTVIETLAGAESSSRSDEKVRDALIERLEHVESLPDRSHYQDVALHLVHSMRHRLRRSAFAILDASHRASVPTYFLAAWLLEDARLTAGKVGMARRPKSGRKGRRSFDDDVFDGDLHPVVATLLERGREGRRALLATIPELHRDDIVRSIVEGLDADTLALAPIETLEAATAAFAQESREDAVVLRIEDAVFRSAVPDLDIERRLVTAGLPSWRSTLFFVAVRRGVTAPRFKEDDPGKSYWTTLWSAHLGNRDAIAELRALMRGDNLSAEAMIDCFRVLGSSATVDDLRHVQFDDDSFDGEQRAAVARSSDEELRRVMSDGDLSWNKRRSIACRVTPPQAEMLLGIALDSECRVAVLDALLDAATDDVAAKVLSRWWRSADEEARRRLLESHEFRSPALAIIAACAMHDSQADIRLDAAAKLYRVTGIARIVSTADGKQIRFGPKSVAESRDDWSKRLARERDAANGVAEGDTPPIEEAGRMQALALRGLPSS